MKTENSDWGGAGEPAQWVEMFAAKPGDLSSAPRTHVVKGETRLLQVAL